MLDWNEIEAAIEVEKKGILASNSAENENDFYSKEIQTELITFLKEVTTQLDLFFKKYPSLQNLFDKEFIAFEFFYKFDSMIEIILFGDFLFMDKEIFPLLNDNGEFNSDYLADYLIFFKEWVSLKESSHLSTKKQIKENLTIDTLVKDLNCHCQECVAEYRTDLRNVAYSLGLEIIDQAAVKMRAQLDAGIPICSDLFYDLKQEIRNYLKKLRQKLKRASINKLELELKEAINGSFTLPAPIAEEYTVGLIIKFKDLLKNENVRRDIISDIQYERFFFQLKTNLWKNWGYLEREFRKLLKSVLLIKRQDISSKILIEYLGEFWIHSSARQIKRKIIYHAGPTNSGKTYHAVEALSKVKKGCYLAPLRLLAGELFDTLNQKGVPTSLLTGEEVIDIPDATHYSSTIEMARFEEPFDCCVIDEIQMLTDYQRGWAWTRAIVNMFCPEIHICGDASVLELVEKIVKLTGDDLEVRYYERMTALEVEKRKIKLGELEKGDAVIVFSRRNALKYKRDIEYLGFKVSIVYGRLSPEVRREQARKFDKEETDVIVSTDAISMGMNLPIRRIVFSTLTKFYNSKEHQINPSEIKQIAGRAGRYGRFPTGYVNCLSRVENGIEDVESALESELEQKDVAMVGPDLEIFRQVNDALSNQGLPTLSLPEFLRLFNTMDFEHPFCCVNLSEMIELAEMVEEADGNNVMSDSEIFGFACAPVNLGLVDHVQYYLTLLRSFAYGRNSVNDLIDAESDDIDYLETTIKCVELYQWLSRHFNRKNFEYDESVLGDNKSKAIDKLNTLLSKKIIKTCSSCGQKVDDGHKFNICESCFKDRRFSYKKKSSFRKPSGSGSSKKTTKKSSTRRYSSSKNSSANKSKSFSRTKAKKR